MTNSKKPRIDSRLFKGHQVQSALCVFEWLINITNKPGMAVDDKQREFDEKIRGLFEDYGWSGMRSVTVQASVFVDQCWDWAEKNADFLTSSSSFDWDFCPMVCRRIDWARLAENNQYGNGAELPDVIPFMSALVAEHALAKPKTVGMTASARL